MAGAQSGATGAAMLRRLIPLRAATDRAPPLQKGMKGKFARSAHGARKGPDSGPERTARGRPVRSCAILGSPQRGHPRGPERRPCGTEEEESWRG